jgi:Zn-dependent M28 family amino/carboxypeptidase
VSLTTTPTQLAQTPVKVETATATTAARTPSQSSGTFDVASALRHVRVLSDQIGVRVAGSSEEREAAQYLQKQLRSAGYAAEIRSFPLPNGSTSQNVVALLPGSSDQRIVLGAHYDTKRPSPGANDNGTGVGVLLEIARELKTKKLMPTIEFVFFGSEEMIDSNADHHHYGSRFHVDEMSASERARVAGMLSVDMIGYGPELRLRTMNRGPQTLRRDLLAFAASRGVGLSYLKDPGKYGWSDHEPFELAGMSAAWIEWRDDPVYHTARDTPAHLSTKKVRTVGQLVLDYVSSLDTESLEALNPH